MSDGVADRISAELRVATGDTAGVRGVRRRFSRELKNDPPHVVIATAELLLRQRSWARRVVAYELILHHKGALEALTEPQVIALSADAEGWGDVDLTAVTLTGPAWRCGVLRDATVLAWSRSMNLWQRRLALVSTVALNSAARGGTGDGPRTLAICDELIGDRERMVVKALSWALRELAKREPATVRKYVATNAEQLPTTVMREVRRRIDMLRP